MAWRDTKASKVRLLLFMASIVLGIAAVVSIQLFSENLKGNIKYLLLSLMQIAALFSIRKFRIILLIFGEPIGILIAVVVSLIIEHNRSFCRFSIVS